MTVKQSSQLQKTEAMPKRKRSASIAARRDPKSRGVHKDALTLEVAKSGRATCGTCNQLIAQGSLRWGLKYAGNPLPEEEVVPLYGSHPMYMWFHEGCGFSLSRHSQLQSAHPHWDAALTCHLCGKKENDSGDLRLRCGGRVKGKKVMFHNFHVACALCCFDNSGHGRPAALDGAQLLQTVEDLTEEEEEKMRALLGVS